MVPPGQSEILMRHGSRGSTSLRAGARRELVGRLRTSGIGAEIGVWKGEFSAELVRQTRPQSLHLVDPWSFSGELPQRWYGGAKARDQKDMDAIYSSVVTKFAKKPEVRIHRMRSSHAAPLFPDGHFDWIYIDGDHSYETVLQDLTLWGPKVRRGGILAGDDYQWRDEAGLLSVARAVREYIVLAGFPEPELLSGQFLFQL